MSPTDLPPRRPAIDAAYTWAALGALLGGGAGAGLGFAIGSGISALLYPDGGLEGIFPVAIGELTGVWIGAVAGAWALLAITHRVAARTTAFMLAGALPAWGIVSLPSFFWLIQQLSGDDIPNALQTVVPVVILCVPPAFAARAVVIQRERRREREESSA